jgi:hypothetical protein
MLGDIAIQGVRAYDPTSSKWTTPDAYSGDVHDPLSQKQFMWNGNNPVACDDPSGYLIDRKADKGLVQMADDMATESATFAATWDSMKSDPSTTWADRGQ